MTMEVHDDITVLDALLREDLASFIQKSFYALAAGRAYRHNWHIEVISWHLTQVYLGKIKRLIVTLPPRHLKSICASVAFPAWQLGHDPTHRIIVVSHSADLAGKFARDCRLIMTSPWYRRVFPKTRLDPKKSAELLFQTTRQGYRLSTSVGGPLTGQGGNLIIIDDPLKADEALSEAARNRVNDWFDTALYSRLDNKAEDRIVIIQQRLHVDDLVGHVIEQENWAHVNIPAIAEDRQTYQVGPDEFHTRYPGDVLQPEREPLEVLQQIKARVGSYNFVAQYQQCPEPPGGNLIKREWLKFYKGAPPKTRGDRIIQSWDTASKAEELSDYSVCTTWLEHNSCYYLIDVARERWEYPDLKRQVVLEARKHRADVVLIEDKGTGTSLIQDLRREGRLRPIPIKVDADKITRMSAQTAKIEAGYVYLPEQAPWLADFVTELLQFPHGRHDDQVDSASQVLNWVTTRARPAPGIRKL